MNAYSVERIGNMTSDKNFEVHESTIKRKCPKENAMGGNSHYMAHVLRNRVPGKRFIIAEKPNARKGQNAPLS